MTPRERVLTTFDHVEGDRVPRWCGASVEFWAKAKGELRLDDEALRVRFGDDFRRIFAVDTGNDAPLKHPEATSRTVFGVERHGLGWGQPLDHPLKGCTLDDVHNFAWPDPARIDASKLVETAGQWGGRYAILGGDWAPFWHDAIDLLGMEGMYMQMYDAPEVVDAVMARMVDFYLASNERVFSAAADVIDICFIGNDFGSQTGPLLSPAMFERFVLPPLVRLLDHARSYGLKTQLHCCGGIAPLIPMLIDAGLDALHAVQPSCCGMDLATLKADFGERIVFNGGIDSHHVLIDGDVETVRAATRKTLEIMMGGGAFVAGASHDTILEETPVENVLAMFDAVEEFGAYGV